MGTYSEGADRSPFIPARSRIMRPDGATIHVNEGEVDSITDDHGQPLSSYELEPLLITGLSEDANRTKRRADYLRRDSAEPGAGRARDRRSPLFRARRRELLPHDGGIASRHLARAPQAAKAASTLTMQLARGFFLTPEQRIKRKIIEILITFQLEHRFTKKQIFKMYANQINLGQRGSFSIDGFGEAAQAYFGKDIRQLDLSECALLAGIIQRPNHFNPFRHPDRAIERRNLVLDSMVETGAITKDQAETRQS